MSLSGQIQRVDGGQNAALKAFIEKFGGTVSGTTKIDGYAALIQALTIYSATQQISATTKSQLGLGSTATPDNALQTLRSLISTAQNTANTAVSSAGAAQSAAQSAQSTATAAQSAASAAQSTADGKPSIESGTYVGDGATTKSLTFSGTPQLLVVNGKGAPDYPSSMVVPRGAEGCFVGGGGTSFMFTIVNIIWDDMTVSWSEDTLHSSVSALNESNKTYHYLALCT